MHRRGVPRERAMRPAMQYAPAARNTIPQKVPWERDPIQARNQKTQQRRGHDSGQKIRRWDGNDFAFHGQSGICRAFASPSGLTLIGMTCSFGRLAVSDYTFTDRGSPARSWEQRPQRPVSVERRLPSQNGLASTFLRNAGRSPRKFIIDN